MLLCVISTACSQLGGNTGTVQETYQISPSPQQLHFGPYEETQTITIETDAGVIECRGPDWCTIKNEGNTVFSIKVSANKGSARSDVISLFSESKNVSVTIPITQSQGGVPSFDSTADIKIGVSGSYASEAQPGEGIALSHDGNLNTMYHSRWGDGTVFPVKMTSYFSNVPRIDYLKYYTRTSGSNGNFQEAAIWVTDTEGLRKYGDYNFNGTSAVISFDPPLINPKQIEFRVTSGLGGYASCAEMEFYRKSSEAFDYLTIFTDSSCSILKSDVTREMINNIPDLFFRDLALQIFLNLYDERHFRVQEYRAWVHPDIQAAENKTSQYSLRDNPTGIYIKKGEELVVFADLKGQHASLLSQDLTTYGGGTQHTYPITAGVNTITAKADGLIYVQYYSASGENAPKIKLNFAAGRVNGYFDSQKHDASQWRTVLQKAAAPDIDLVGKFAHLTFPVSLFKELTPNGKALIDKWDELIRLEHEFMGLYKYNRVFKNRLYVHFDYDPKSPYMYATSYRTAYSRSSVHEVIKLDTFTANPWGGAHEAGHVNQVRPGVKWSGMTEVTTNIYSLYVQTSFGNKSRLMRDNVYNSAFDSFLGKNIPHNDAENVWIQLVPFWQLKLYLHDALGKTDFYKDLFYHYMTNPDPGTAAETDGRFQLYFVKAACETARLNLLEFFEKWGFLTPIDKGTGGSRFTITQAQIDSLKAEITARNYEMPEKDFTRITDDTINLYY